MDKNFKGTIDFRKKDFEDHKHLFQELGKKQKPHTLFIACSDSRVVPNMIANALPGEFFVIRNIANIVPTFRQTNEYLATTSAIEFAIKSLNVENIIVCGHSNCGGCASLYLSEDELSNIPHTKKWLELSEPVKNKVLSFVKEDELSVREWMTEQLNIVEQIKHLLTYPYIKDKFSEGQLKIFGWYYIIETGEIFNYNQENSIFELIN